MASNNNGLTKERFDKGKNWEACKNEMISSILVLDYALRLKILHTIPTRIPKQSEFRSEQDMTGKDIF